MVRFTVGITTCLSYASVLALKALYSTEHTSGFGTKSSPKGVSTFVKVLSVSHTPKKSSGKARSAGPPPTALQALSMADGRLTAYTSFNTLYRAA